MNTSHTIPFIAVVMALALGACATTHEQTAERFKLAEVAIENAELIANNLHGQGLISEADWPLVRAGLDAATADVAKAKAANEANPDLNVAWEVLTELNRRLLVMQGAPQGQSSRRVIGPGMTGTAIPPKLR